METTRFDAAEYLDTPARRVAYFNAALETGDAEEIRDALNIVARARGLADVAREAHLSRTSLYRTLGGNGNPELSTTVRVLAALGMRLTVAPVKHSRSKPHNASQHGKARPHGRRRQLEAAHA
jgi:probable addiction module antidote protein